MTEQFDLNNFPVYPPAEKAKNVFFQCPEFKTRMILLKADEQGNHNRK